MNSAVFATLPGIETPVGDLRRALAELWDPEPEPAGMRGAGRTPTEFRASQMNLVLHFGLDTQPQQAVAGFETALAFSRRYPCRIIALCPRAPGGGGDSAAKIFSDCYIGSSGRDKTCTEAIIFTYPLEQRVYLEDQASILLESDLPLFYWPQYINRASRLGDYRQFLERSQRIVIDSAVEKPDVREFAWPRPEVVHDLAWGRILPVRQSMGHFLSYIPPGRLVQGLERIELRHRPEFASEAGALARWIARGLAGCAPRESSQRPGTGVKLRADGGLEESLAVAWTYGDAAGRLDFRFDFARGTSRLESTLDCETNHVSATIRLLPPDRALAEVLFF